MDDPCLRGILRIVIIVVDGAIVIGVCSVFLFVVFVTFCVIVAVVCFCDHDRASGSLGVQRDHSFVIQRHFFDIEREPSAPLYVPFPLYQYWTQLSE